MGVGSGAQEEVTVTLGDTGVVTGCNEVATHLVRQMEHLTPLDGGIAEDAWVRRSAGHILVDEVLNDAAPEGLAKVHDMVLKAHSISVMLRLHDGVDGAAAFLFGEAGLFDGVIGTERHTHDFIALLQKKHGADGGVYSS